MTSKTGKTRPASSPTTDIIHEGREPGNYEGFVNPPAYRGSTVLFPTLDAFKSGTQSYNYGRRATPTTRALETALCHLEGGSLTTLTSSGLQAISTALLAVVKTGDHILIPDSVYVPTRTFCDTTLKKLGVQTTYYDATLAGQIETRVKANTTVIFTESPGSLTFELQDIPAISKVAQKHDIWHLMDNTWATPLYFKALHHGVDISIHAATKYIVGHADAMLGVVTGNERAARHINRAKESLGTCPGSEETFLAARGLRTMGVRLAEHFRSGVEIAKWLEQHDEVERVIHPALPTHPQHEIWKRDFCGATGLFTVILKPVSDTALAAMVDEMRYFGMGYSWGGYESLILPFDPRSMRTKTNWTEKGAAVRLHIGLEDTADLIADLEAGFARMKNTA